jgi:hypothetical protein
LALPRSADLEIGDTADLELCATCFAGQPRVLFLISDFGALGAVIVEHAAYGCVIFTIGLGRYFLPRQH